jgi:hypothetical protein
MADDDETTHTPESSEPESGSTTPKVTRLADRRRRNREQIRPVPADTLTAREQAARMILGPDCPYVPVGKEDGRKNWVICCDGHLTGLGARDLQRAQMVHLCGGDEWLKKRYPRFRQGKPVDGFANEKACDEMIAACHVMGPFHPESHRRGAGSWTGADGDLILHRGNLIYAGDVAMRPTRLGEYVYEPRPALPALPGAKDSVVRTAGEDLLARLDTFLFERGAFDSILVLGWICCAIVGGALKWRPHIWFNGELGTGKSTVQTLLNGVFGRPAGILSVTDATPAGLRQFLRGASIPVGYDEFEATPESVTQDMVIKIIRDASSEMGGYTLRGGANHDPSAFPITSCFACSSVLTPQMPSQDRSRFVRIEIMQDVTNTPQRPFSPDRLEAIGAALTRRMMTRFRELRASVIPAFELALRRRGATQRIADLYGAIFGAAAVALHDDVADFRFAEHWLENRHMQALLIEELAEQTPEWRRCLDYLITSRIDPRHAESASFGMLIEQATAPLLGLVRDGLFSRPIAEAEQIVDAYHRDDNDVPARAAARLAAFGLKVSLRTPGGSAQPEPVLLIANQHRSLATIFDRTVWRSLPNAAGGGGWAQATKRAPGAKLTSPMRFAGGLVCRAVMVPIKVVLSPTQWPPAAPPQAADYAEDGDAAAAIH